MNTQMVEIQPRELKFIFELKKQISCTVHLANVTEQYVAFKVKTTSPKKYCVRPNVGIIKPQSMSDFTVTMQAQKSAPSEMLCKDKFLIQTTVVPCGTTEDDITSAMFARDGGKYMEETKLRVVLTSAPNSPEKPRVPGVWKQEASLEASTPKELNLPILSPVNRVVIEPSYETSMPQVPGFLKQEASYEDLMLKEPHSPVLLPLNGISKQEPSNETSKPKNNLQDGTENSSPPDMLLKEEDSIKNSRNMEDPVALKVMDNIRSVPAKEEESKWVTDTENIKLKLNEDIKKLKMKISVMDVKLVEAEDTIVKLKEEKSSTVYEMQMLKQELAMARKKSGARKVQAGFPPLFVCMVAIISLMMGFLFRS